MAEQVFPTKGNLIKAKRSLQQAKQGFELMTENVTYRYEKWSL